MFNSELKKTAILSFEASEARYKQLAKETQILSSELMIERQRSVQAIEHVEQFINSIANTEKIFNKDFGQINVYVSKFRGASEFKAESMDIAEVGGGVARALTARGRGISPDTFLLGLVVALVGSAAVATINNKKIADKVYSEKAKVESIIRKFKGSNKEIIEIKDLTVTHARGINESLRTITALNKQNYLDYTANEKLALGALVNNTLSLAKLLDRTVKIPRC